MSSNVPATREETPTTRGEERLPLAPQRPLSVAFLPLALVTFVVLAFIIAAWTFLAAAA